MKRKTGLAGLLVLSLIAFNTYRGEAHAGVLQSFKDCVPGKRVATSDNHVGTITRLDPAWSYCYVRQDDTGREVSYLYSLLQPIGDAKGRAGNAPAAKPDDNQLASGVYECSADGHAAFTDIKITGPNTYVSAGKSGRYHIETSGQIVYETGPLKPYHSKILEGHRIGLNTNGDSFYATSCDLNRNRR